MEPRGRGRAWQGARGRGRSDQGGNRPPQGGPQQGQQRPGPPQQGGGRPQSGPQPGPARPPQGAWGSRPQQQQQPMPAAAAGAGVPPPKQYQPQQAVGRGSRVGAGDEKSHSGAAQQAGAGRDTQERGGNGGVRGRANRAEIIHTKPPNMQSKKGSSGVPVKLVSNFFRLVDKPNWCLHQYRVDFEPNIDDTRKRKRLMAAAYRGEKDLSGFIFDGTVLVTPLNLPQNKLEKHSQLEGDSEPTRIRIRHVGELTWGDYHYLQVFNLIIRICLEKMNLQLISRNYFDPSREVKIPEHKLCLWPGYFTSIRQYEKDVMMNTELTFKVMRLDNMYDLFLNTVDRSGRHDANEYKKRVLGCVVYTYYNNRTYRVDDIDYSITPKSTFTLKKTGQEITYIDYFKERYKIKIQVPQQPMLVYRSKPREILAGMPDVVLLPPELCQMTGLTDEQRANFQLMAALAQHTRIGPMDRQRKLVDFVNRLASTPEALEVVKKWDMNVAKQLVEFDGRVLPQEKIRLGENVSVMAGQKADWTMSLRSNPMVIAGRMERLAVVTPKNLAQPTDDFMKMVVKTASAMKLNFQSYRLFEIHNDRSQGYLEKLDEVYEQANPTLIMCVLQSKSADRYNVIKKRLLCDKGCPSQIVVARNFRSKGVMSIATKVAIQLNCKIGGAPWTVNVPMKNLMVVGYDVCRDTANKSKSFGAMVASMDQGCTRYYSAVFEHQLSEELSNHFSSFMLVACQRYKEVNGVYPAKIIIYRDGVGDGQIGYVRNMEIENIKKVLEEMIYTEPNSLKLAVVVVSKRINTRIFERGNNPPPGTVVDDVITLPERYDFYIVSQCVNQGTVAPTSYNVIYDTMGLTPDQMQILSYKMCHLYYNWSGTVRVPAPCQYAHKLAFLTAQSLHRPANRKLENLLYFL